MDDDLLFCCFNFVFGLLSDLSLSSSFRSRWRFFREFHESHPPWLRYTYFTILISHIILAMYVPIGALITIYHGLKDHRPHAFEVGQTDISNLVVCIGNRRRDLLDVVSDVVNHA